MSGNREGGRKTAETIKKRYGKDYYAKMGKKGGKISTTGGFASDKVGKDGLTGKERAAIAGAKGGKAKKHFKKKEVEQNG